MCHLNPSTSSSLRKRYSEHNDGGRDGDGGGHGDDCNDDGGGGGDSNGHDDGTDGRGHGNGSGDDDNMIMVVDGGGGGNNYGCSSGDNDDGVGAVFQITFKGRVSTRNFEGSITIKFVGSGGQLCRVFDLRPLSYLKHCGDVMEMMVVTTL